LQLGGGGILLAFLARVGGGSNGSRGRGVRGEGGRGMRREEGEWRKGRYFFDDGLVVLAFGRGGLGAGGEGEEVCADFVVGEDGGLGLEDLGVGGWV